ncbi:diguanylate cyclase [Lonsdalea britannica]|uniref:diguanylate cyclase n=1 Tax=Lonsdalea britannica TaxID=1082704 RepID=A0AAD0SCG1_9GAMM|nr:diguanylate cyclase [Lonsdalea britannica]AXW85545.1 sensor domain-containing diguanylate cyclase [Lonsdalea britannica]OSM94014.1 diguanylate cyclase [Lonsdalea britannica]OSN03674.1 diguanylate cyclase [Lonsdalea britannica]
MYEIIITLLIILLGVSSLRNRKRLEKSTNENKKLDFLNMVLFAAEYSPAALLIANENCEIVYVNRQFISMSGYEAEEVIGQNTRMLSSGMTNASVYEELWETLNKGDIWNGEFINRKKNGQLYWEKASIVKIYNKASNAIQYVGIKMDITERKTKEYHDNSYNRALELLSSGAPLKDILDAIIFSVEEKNPGRIVCSVLLIDKDKKCLTLGSAPSLPGFYKNAIHNVKIADGAASFGTAAYTGKRVIAEDISTDPSWSLYKGLALYAGLRSCWSEPVFGQNDEILAVLSVYHRKVYSPAEDEIESIEKSAQLVSVAIERYRAIDMLRRSEEHYRQLAHYDSLTSLANGLTFAEQMEQAIQLSKQTGRKIALMFLDLDRFKQINDTFGHAVGDLLLKEAAARMRLAVRDSDTVYRRSGDEFIILLQGIKEQENTLYVADKIHYALNEPFDIEGKTLDISCSIGIALYPEHGADALSLAINADAAMYQAKTLGRSQTKIYNDVNTH